ncbi:hypothetical protein AB1N83_012407, partial [Pleurotus pulmonarius]
DPARGTVIASYSPLATVTGSSLQIFEGIPKG